MRQAWLDAWRAISNVGMERWAWQNIKQARDGQRRGAPAASSLDCATTFQNQGGAVKPRGACLPAHRRIASCIVARASRHADGASAGNRTAGIWRKQAPLSLFGRIVVFRRALSLLSVLSGTPLRNDPLTRPRAENIARRAQARRMRLPYHRVCFALTRKQNGGIA